MKLFIYSIIICCAIQVYGQNFYILANILLKRAKAQAKSLKSYMIEMDTILANLAKSDLGVTNSTEIVALRTRVCQVAKHPLCQGIPRSLGTIISDLGGPTKAQRITDCHASLTNHSINCLLTTTYQPILDVNNKYINENGPFFERHQVVSITAGPIIRTTVQRVVTPVDKCLQGR